MKKSIIFLILFSIAFELISQNVKIFEGSIDKYPIRMVLNFNENKAYGFYYYKKYGKPIQISGEKVNGKYILDELIEIKGMWETETSAKFSFNENGGTWKTNSQTLNISLKEVELKSDWGIFKNKVDLIHTFSNGKTHKYPIEVALIYPEDRKIRELVMPEVLNVKKISFGDMWAYYNNYVIERYKEYLLEEFSEEFPQYFEISMNGQLMFLSDSLATYRTSGYTYTGGAHGYGFEYYYVFDLNKNEILEFNDIFIENSENQIAEIIFELDKGEHKKEDIAKNLKNFYMTDKGVGFVFNPYAIDCYACGIFNYFIDYSKLTGLIK